MRSVTQQAARQLTTDLARARVNAIDSGRTMVIRYEPGASRYTIMPADTISESTESRGSAYGEMDASDVTDESSASDVTDESSASDELRITAQLDDDVIFQDPASVAENDIPADSTLGKSLRDEMQQTEEVRPLVQNSQDETSWSPPVMVYPTGRAENAQFVLRGPDGYSVTVTLRGLTGAVTTGPLVHQRRTTDKPPGEDLPGQPPPPSARESSELSGAVE